MAVLQWATPHAKRLVGRNATDTARAEAFRAGLPSGDAAAVLGVDPRRTALELWNVKTGRKPYRTDADAARTEVSQAFVPGMIALFCERQDLTTRRVGILAARTRPWQLATIDALTSDGGTLEVTTTTHNSIGNWVHPATDAPLVPEHVRARVQHDLAVTGRSHGWVACVVLDTRTLLIRRVERDEQAITALVEAETLFWQSHIQADVAPPLSARDTDLLGDVYNVGDRTGTREAPSMLSLRDRRERLRDEIAFLEREVDAIDAAAKAEAGNAVVLTADGVKVVSWDYTSSAFDAKAFTTAFPDLASRYTVVKAQLDWLTLLAEHPEHTSFRGRRINWTPSEKGRKTDGDRAHRNTWKAAA